MDNTLTGSNILTNKFPMAAEGKLFENIAKGLIQYQTKQCTANIYIQFISAISVAEISKISSALSRFFNNRLNALNHVTKPLEYLH